jgi:hypothetical protein
MSTSLQLRTTAAPQTKDLRNRQEERIWHKLRKPDLPVRKKEADLWRVGSPKEEARALYKMLGRNGDDVHSLRSLIMVSPTEEIELRDWAASSSPRVAVGIEAMIHHRQEVLLQFDRLVASSQNADALPQRAGLSSNMS